MLSVWEQTLLRLEQIVLLRLDDTTHGRCAERLHHELVVPRAMALHALRLVLGRVQVSLYAYAATLVVATRAFGETPYLAVVRFGAYVTDDVIIGHFSNCGSVFYYRYLITYKSNFFNFFLLNFKKIEEIDKTKSG